MECFHYGIVGLDGPCCNMEEYLIECKFLKKIIILYFLITYKNNLMIACILKFMLRHIFTTFELDRVVYKFS